MPRRPSKIRRRMSSDLDEVADAALARREHRKAGQRIEDRYRHAIFRAWDGGYTIDEIAAKITEATGERVSRQRVHQIVRSEKNE